MGSNSTQGNTVYQLTCWGGGGLGIGNRVVLKIFFVQQNFKNRV